MTWRASSGEDTATLVDRTLYTKSSKLPGHDKVGNCLTFDKHKQCHCFQPIMRYVSNPATNIVCEINLQRSHEFALVGCGGREVAIKQGVGGEVITCEDLLDSHSMFTDDFNIPLGSCEHYQGGGVVWCQRQCQSLAGYTWVLLLQASLS